jgi:hypothetical protein
MNDMRIEDKLTTSDIATAAKPQQSRIAEEGDRGDRARRDHEMPPRSRDVPIAEDRPVASAAGPRADDSPLFPEEETRGFRAEWDEIQSAFVDEPRRSVERADELVARTMQRLAQIFSDERGRLEAPWGRGEQVSTEDLRLALQRYRSFFGRLLSA